MSKKDEVRLFFAWLFGMLGLVWISSTPYEFLLIPYGLLYVTLLYLLVRKEELK